MRELGLPSGTTGTVVTVGTFDGFHRGHQDLVARLLDASARLNLPSVVLTFAPHPLEVVRPADAPALLTPGYERLEALAGTGLDRVVVLPFTRDVAELSAERYVQEVLIGTLGVRRLLIGHDHGFGRNRSGDENTLRALGAIHGFDVEVVGAVKDDGGTPISSSRVRRAVAAGDLAGAARMLGSPYAASGRVVHGAGRGRGIGFRTLNLSLADERKLLPPLGVYAVRVWTPEGPFGGMMNFGARPTFGVDEVGLEAHLFDASNDWYGATVRLEFVEYLRAVRRFEDVSALRAQLERDELDARSALTSFAESGTLRGSASL
ncbi:MAG TPA: bifunctional riboflavin kinase/FAD synthetase [Gemmatimonadales bacterium]|nr:bifunctional riboflavin kinase/FAD synthetase [Gemmatimonadales bacterium]